MSIVDLSSRVPSLATPARFSVSQFDAMINAGVFKDDSGKVQLIHGEILFMTPPNPPHDDVIQLLTAWAFAMLPNANEQLEVRVQLSMDLIQQDSVVSPDLMLVTARSYSNHRPTAADTRLLVEVSDTSLSYDLGAKLALYAEAGVAEYWVIDIPHRALIVHCDPADGRYGTVKTYDENETVQSVVVPGVSLVLNTLFR